MKHRIIRCYPGKGILSSSRVSLAHEKGKCVGSLGKIDLRSQVDHVIQDFKSEKGSFNLGSQEDHEVQIVNRLGSFDLGSSGDRVSHTQQRLSRVDRSLDKFTLAPQGDSTTLLMHLCE